MAVRKVKPDGMVPHYESSTQGPFTGVSVWAKRQAGVMRDGEHARPGSWVPGYVENQRQEDALELPKAKNLKKHR